MNILKSIVICLTLFISPSLLAESINLKLKDGSAIAGQLKSVSGGVYTIQTNSLGTIKIQQSQIQQINMGGGTSNSQSGSGSNAGLQQLQTSIMNDPKMMRSISDLAADPAIMKMLKDPKLMQAIHSGDLNSLANNPDMMKLMNNPKIKNLSGQITGK